jgi:transposase
MSPKEKARVQQSMETIKQSMATGKPWWLVRTLSTGVTPLTMKNDEN